MTPATQPRHRKNSPFVVAFCAFILLSGMLGFGFKLYELTSSAFSSPEYRFALPPVLTYLTVAAGFLCILVYATLRGMFRNIEGPKYRMLEMEAQWDAAEERRTPRSEAKDADSDSDTWWKGDVHR